LQNRQLVGSIKADGMARQIAGSQDWRCVVYAKNQAGQNNLLIYNLTTLFPLAQLSCPGTPLQVAVSRTGRFLAATDDNNVVYIWDIQSGKGVSPLTGHAEAVTSLAFSPNERQLVSCSSRSVIAWDLIKGVEDHRISVQDSGAAAVTFSPDGTRLLISGRSTEVSVYNAQAGTLTAQISASPESGSGSFTRAIVSFADGRAVALVGTDGLIRVWRLPP
jgi:WD40 repeat protein